MAKKYKTLRNVDSLYTHGLITEQERAGLLEVTQQFAMAMTPTIQKCIDSTAPEDPIAKQFIPHRDELVHQENELTDPVGDIIFEKVSGLVHRYPDRCLLKVVNACPVYCRFCFRRELLGAKSSSMNANDLQLAYEYIEMHSEIWEVILTGGDPFILKPKQIANILNRLSEIPHVEVIRIHTRVPLVDPARISSELVAALKVSKAVYVVLHANHANEFTPEGIRACGQLVNSGIPMLSQSVLLKGVNDDPESLSNLMKTFVRHRIKPYYLHHPDLAKGTSHFRVSLEEGQRLIRHLRGRLSGLCQPQYILDIPGGFGKVPVGPNYIHSLDHKKWLVEDYLGNSHVYECSLKADN